MGPEATDGAPPEVIPLLTLLATVSLHGGANPSPAFVEPPAITFTIPAKSQGPTCGTEAPIPAGVVAYRVYAGVVRPNEGTHMVLIWSNRFTPGSQDGKPKSLMVPPSLAASGDSVRITVDVWDAALNHAQCQPWIDRKLP